MPNHQVLCEAWTLKAARYESYSAVGRRKSLTHPSRRYYKNAEGTGQQTAEQRPPEERVP